MHQHRTTYGSPSRGTRGRESGPSHTVGSVEHRLTSDLGGIHRAVIYAAKSTEDRHGSIPTQLEDCRGHGGARGLGGGGRVL